MPALANDVRIAHSAFERQQRELRSPAARAERRASRTAFVGLSARDSLRIAARQHENFVGAPAYQGLQGTPGERVVEYLSDTSAVVAGANFEGGRAMVVSTSPLVTEEGDPVDLTLVDSGAVAMPEHPLVPVRIAEEGPAGFVLPDQDLRVVAGSGGDAVRSDGVVLRAGAGGLDTDVVTRPSTDGAEVGWILRSARSPEELTMRLDLPDGAVLREVDRGYAVEQDGKAIAAVTPPVAFDADGSPVELDVSVELDAIRIGIAHRDEDVAYPLLVDPEVVVFGTSQFPTPGQEVPHLGQWNNWFHYDYTAPTQPVVDVRAWVGSFGNNPAHRRAFWLDAPFAYYGPNQYATWEYDPPGNAMISGVSFHDMAWFYSAGICSYGGVGGPNNLWASTNWLWCHQYHSQSWAINVPPHPDNRIVTGFHTQGGPAHRWMYYTINEIRVHLEDDGPAPVVQLDVPTGWTNDPNAAITATATDNGLGIKSLSIDGPAGWAAPHKPATQTNTCAVGPCPLTTTLSGTVGPESGGIPDGERTITATATSPNGGSDTESDVVRIDRTPPTIELSEFLAGAAPDVFQGGAYELHIDASDGAGSTAAAGVTRIRVLIDGQQVDLAEQTCDPGGCDMPHDWALYPHLYALGAHTLTVEATDAAGNVGSVAVPVDVQAASPRTESNLRPDVDDAEEPSPDDPPVPNDCQLGPERDCNATDTNSPFNEAVTAEPSLDSGAPFPLLGDASFLYREPSFARIPPNDDADNGWGLSDQRDDVIRVIADIANNRPAPFANTIQALGLTRFRLVVPWDVVPRGRQAWQASGEEKVYANGTWKLTRDAARLDWVDEWMQAARTVESLPGVGRVDIMVSFERSRVFHAEHPENLNAPDTAPEGIAVSGVETSAFKKGPLPTLDQYRQATNAFRKRYPFVKVYGAWNEPNFTIQPTQHNATAAGEFWRNLNRRCQDESQPEGLKKCMAVAGEFYDFPSAVGAYLATYKIAADYSEQHPPRAWSIHPYATAHKRKLVPDPEHQGQQIEVYDSTRMQRFINKTAAPDEVRQPKIWLTELGAKVSTYGAPAALDDYKHLLAMTKMDPRITRAYQYMLAHPGDEAFDTALLDESGEAREMYCLFKTKATGEGC